MYAIAVDTGGTFTDVSLMDLESGRVWTAKTPSTPADPSAGLANGVAKVLRQAGVAPEQVSYVLHGTTVATNAVLQRRGARTGLVTTEGFRYVLDNGRHDIPRGISMYLWQKPERPVTPDAIVEVNERIDHAGGIIGQLDEAGVRQAATQLRQAGVESVAVCLINSYRNPEHERRVGAILAEELPGMHISLSCDVHPEFREYERTMVTSLNAYLRPQLNRYLAATRGRLQEMGVTGPILVMQSNGGVVGAETLAVRPVQSLLSGPAAGVVAAAQTGKQAGFPDVISIDIGGTSADVSLIQNGRAEMTTRSNIGDFPLTLNTIDITTIGAGGGSIAAVTPGVGLQVGPDSAGADPGPACYGRIGAQSTVTDANVVLGRIPTQGLDGEHKLSRERAEQAIREQVAWPLGLDLHQAALGIIEIVNHNMAGAIRAVSIERGFDPAQFALVAFGGGGPIHAGRLAEILEIPTVLIPRSPGVLSTFGLLSADLKTDLAMTRLYRGPDYDLAQMEADFRSMAEQAEAWFAAEGVPAADRMTERAMDLRYPRQMDELTVPVPDDPLTPGVMRAVEQAFHEKHERMYTHSFPGSAVAVVSLRLTGRAAVRKLLQPAWTVGGVLADARIGSQQVCFTVEEGLVDCPVYARERLPQGVELEGPAVIIQSDCTVLMHPRHTARVDDWGNLVVSVPVGAGARTAPVGGIV